jgi:hypothetical protein
VLGKSRAELLDSMDAVELTEWEALYTHIEPLPEDRADLRMGITVANGLSPHLKKGTTVRPADFMPDFSGQPKKPKQTIEQMKAIWKQVQAAWNRPRKK